ncbi:hypothetical protein BT63DRAFT_442271 [Microthyrium microscopicum]|uniref:Uncharacterized protein n=1 Tax=Microthyrium microscopicum TaxID=703497 RepID=A0A6A6U2P3_9PEZI|nr:hypothetical protein BT63DRAFT_442271 [Microthyrium microscopicum]
MTRSTQDPLKPKPARVQKRRSQVRDFPSWFQTALRHDYAKDPFYGGSFCRRDRGKLDCDCPKCSAPENIYDEDLSELGDDWTLPDLSPDYNCYCDTYASRCECDLDDPNCECEERQDDDEISHAGTLCEQFDEFNKEREERQLELRRLKDIREKGAAVFAVEEAARLKRQRERAEARELAREERVEAKRQAIIDKARTGLLDELEAYEDRVKSVYDSLKTRRKTGEKGKKTPFQEILYQRFQLYSSDLVRANYPDESELELWDSYDEEHYTPNHYIEFDLPRAVDSEDLKRGERIGKSRMLSASLGFTDGLYSSTSRDFRLPKRASRKHVVAPIIESNYGRNPKEQLGHHKMTIQFLGKRCLKLRISRSFFIEQGAFTEGDATNGPEMLELVGVLHELIQTGVQMRTKHDSWLEDQYMLSDLHLQYSSFTCAISKIRDSIFDNGHVAGKAGFSTAYQNLTGLASWPVRSRSQQDHIVASFGFLIDPELRAGRFQHLTSSSFPSTSSPLTVTRYCLNLLNSFNLVFSLSATLAHRTSCKFGAPTKAQVNLVSHPTLPAVGMPQSQADALQPRSAGVRKRLRRDITEFPPWFQRIVREGCYATHQDCYCKRGCQPPANIYRGKNIYDEDLSEIGEDSSLSDEEPGDPEDSSEVDEDPPSVDEDSPMVNVDSPQADEDDKTRCLCHPEDEDCFCGSDDSDCECEPEDYSDEDSLQDDEKEKIKCQCDPDDSDCDCDFDYSDCDCEPRAPVVLIERLNEKYHHHKTKREALKRVIKEGEEYDKKAQARALIDEEFHMNKVKRIYDSLKARRESGAKGEDLSMKDFARQGFYLFSTDLFKTNYYDGYTLDFYHPHHYLDFQYPDECGDVVPMPKFRPNRVEASRAIRACLNVEDLCFLLSSEFMLPEQARRKKIKTVFPKGQCPDGRFKFKIQFVGKDYIRLRLPRSLITSTGRASDTDAPKFFNFVGIRRSVIQGV